LLGEIKNGVSMNGVVVMESGEKDTEEILANDADRPLGGHVVDVMVVEAAQLVVGGDNVRNDLFP